MRVEWLILCGAGRAARHRECTKGGNHKQVGPLRREVEVRREERREVGREESRDESREESTGERREESREVRREKRSQELRQMGRRADLCVVKRER